MQILEHGGIDGALSLLEWVSLSVMPYAFGNVVNITHTVQLTVLINQLVIFIYSIGRVCPKSCSLPESS